MYIQITNRCNMSCPHCGMNCTAEGQDMTMETFKNAVEYDACYVTIGGGEPTLHPNFWEMLIVALTEQHCEGAWMATNGSDTDISLRLLKLSKIMGDHFACDLSLDDFHDPIDYEVEEAFRNVKRVRTATNITRVGRGATLSHDEYYFEENENCVCAELITRPNGDVYHCGCDDAPCYGNINDTVTLPDEYNHECYKDREILEEAV